MPTLEERVAFLEGRVAEHSRGMDGIREAVVHLEERMDRRLGTLDRRVNGLDEKMSRYFVWIVGVQVTTLAAIVAALASRP